MRILLIGEYSGFHNHLKDGLLELGHEVVLASTSDGFKKIDVDVNWDTQGDSLYAKFAVQGKIMNDVRKLKGFDVVQFINPVLFRTKFGFNEYMIKWLQAQNKKSFLVVAGDDATVWKYWKHPGVNGVKYTWIQDVINDEYRGAPSLYDGAQYINWNKKLAQSVAGIIPIAYEYSLPYKEYEHLCGTIPMPINVNKIEYRENKLKSGKLIIFHGLNREASKGTKYVRAAFEILKERYPNDLELIIDGKMPYKEYLEMVNGLNVVVDQTNSYGLGMNALLSMAMGKIVMGGAEPESIKGMGYKFCPAINITPDPRSIVEGVEYLLDNRKHIGEMGQESRRFVEEHHNYLDVAGKYLATWENC